MEEIKKNYEIRCNRKSDINEHLPVLYDYAQECESVLELGVRGVVSSWAFLYGLVNNESRKKTLFLNDITPCNINEIMNCCTQTNVQLVYEWKNCLDINLTDNIDLLFIDTWHVYGQLKRELSKFHDKVNKFIIMHDTTIDGEKGESLRIPRFRNNIANHSKQFGIPEEEIKQGLWKAIEEFVSANTEWKIHKRYTNNNGLTVLKRISKTC